MPIVSRHRNIVVCEGKIVGRIEKAKKNSVFRLQGRVRTLTRTVLQVIVAEMRKIEKPCSSK